MIAPTKVSAENFPFAKDDLNKKPFVLIHA